MSTVPPAIASAHDPERFRSDGHVDAAHGGGAALSALVSAVLFRDGHHTYEAFAQQASYLFAGTLECTKRMMSIELWTALRVHGEAWSGQVVDRLFELARIFAGTIAASDDFELALAPEAKIVCFRHRTADNRALREAALRDGRFHIVGTELPGGYHLRSTVMNPLTEPSDFDALLAHLRSLCRR